MYVVMNRIEVEPERAETFEAHFGASMKNTLGEVPGLVRSSLLKPAQPGLPYVAQMEFDTKESFMGWLHSDAFRAAHGHAPGGGTGDAPGGGTGDGPSVEAYDVIVDVAP